MTEDYEDAIMRLKKLCNDNGLYSLSSIIIFLHAAPGRTQKEIAALTRQSVSSVNDWIDLFSAYGLLEAWEKKRFRKHEIKLTKDGETLLAGIRAIICP